MRVLWVLGALVLVEIGLFVWIGGQIGVVPVLALVVISALGGVLVLRGRLGSLPALARAGAEPGRLLVSGAITAIGAALLILPGFLTDLAGLALLLPPVQRALIAALGRGIDRARASGRATVIEGTFEVHEPGPGQPPERQPPRGH
jgi:UPF0716 family protein affecting phage T7 exclusion